MPGLQPEPDLGRVCCERAAQRTASTQGIVGLITPSGQCLVVSAVGLFVISFLGDVLTKRVWGAARMWLFYIEIGNGPSLNGIERLFFFHSIDRSVLAGTRLLVFPDLSVHTFGLVMLV